jgi:ketosteroid isomerase-like protein
MKQLKAAIWYFNLIGMIMGEDRELLTRIYKAFNERDIDSVLMCLHPDVDWPNGWEGGRIYGRESVRDYWTRQWKELDPYVEPVGFTTDESGRTIVDVHSRVLDIKGNIIFDGNVTHIYLIVDGLVTSMDIAK